MEWVYNTIVELRSLQHYCTELVNWAAPLQEPKGNPEADGGKVLTSAIQMGVYEVHQDLQDWVAALICILCVKLPISNLG